MAVSAISRASLALVFPSPRTCPPSCRDALRDYVTAGIGGPAGVLAVNETGFLKKGRMLAGVQRQYPGTAGRIENCQIGVFLAYTAPGGERTLIDWELYVPESWFADRDRCRQAGIGDGTVFATKPELGLADARARPVRRGPVSWVAADEVYGQNPHLRSWLGGDGISYVMACPAARRSRPRRARCAPMP